MKYYLNKAFFPVVYLFFTAVTGTISICLENNLLWLKIILAIINIGIYTLLIVMYAFKIGEEAVRTRMHNDIIRHEIIKTGKDLPIKRTEEYKPYKGFLIGLISCIPLAVLWIVYFSVWGITGAQKNVISGITMILYMVIISFFNMDANSILSVTGGGFYYSALYIPYILLLWGLAYYFGARRAERLNVDILKKQKALYGDNSEKKIENS